MLNHALETVGGCNTYKGRNEQNGIEGCFHRGSFKEAMTIPTLEFHRSTTWTKVNPVPSIFTPM